ncbi:hypothetical protein LOD99_829 [Oopsacas minuta]|uniref:Uncharacterized protein n=1 Tax=Oopsacas minuta TaxID=111878 RepID=A0AAV7JZN2_9METZ|nr:hypothetical protein LOD99_829 [Oopsacas minuta]
MVNVMACKKSHRHLLNYPNLESAIRPVPHCSDLPVPIFTEFLGLYDDEDGANSEEVNDHDCDYDVDFQGPSSEPSLFNQAELNDLIRDLDLSKEFPELLASRLQEKNLLHQRTKNGLVFCPNVEGLLLAMGVPNYNPSDWRLFTDSSKRSLKCALLHNGNIFGSIPIGYSVKHKEEYNNVKEILEIINYSAHDWVICVDLKMVNFLLGQQSGFTNYPCFLCYWDSRDRNQHWIRDKWPPRECLKVGDKNHWIKTYCFKYIRNYFPEICEEKKKAGIFEVPQIRKLLRDNSFKDSMNDGEKRAWRAFSNVISNFLDNKKAANYKKLVTELVDSYHALGCNMSIKIHYLRDHLDRFPDILGDMSEEQGERFYQDIKMMKQRYQGRCDTHMMADYC